MTTSAVLSGKCFRYGDDINTDVIIPARYMTTTDPVKLGQHCMEDLDPEFLQKREVGDMIVAGKNFGCGSSREHAPISIRAAGISCVIAETFARIFFRNAVNIGLPIFECPEAVQATADGDRLEVDAERGIIRNLTKGTEYEVKPLPPFMQEIIEAGGLMEKLVKDRAAGKAV